MNTSRIFVNTYNMTCNGKQSLRKLFVSMKSLALESSPVPPGFHLSEL